MFDLMVMNWGYSQKLAEELVQPAPVEGRLQAYRRVVRYRC